MGTCQPNTEEAGNYCGFVGLTFEATAYFRFNIESLIRLEKFLYYLILDGVAGNDFCNDNEHRTACENDFLPIVSLFFTNNDER